MLLAVAANDTTRHASAHAIYAFSKFPDQRALLVEDVPGRIDTAVEEVLRWASPLLHMRRTATQDVTVRARRSRPATRSSCGTISGNRDEDVFEDPFTFDILRNPNPHIAFGGGGPHFCLGAALARTMLRSLLTEVYTRIPDISAPCPTSSSPTSSTASTACRRPGPPRSADYLTTDLAGIALEQKDIHEDSKPPCCGVCISTGLRRWECGPRFFELWRTRWHLPGPSGRSLPKTWDAGGLKCSRLMKAMRARLRRGSRRLWPGGAGLVR